MRTTRIQWHPDPAVTPIHVTRGRLLVAICKFWATMQVEGRSGGELDWGGASPSATSATRHVPGVWSSTRVGPPLQLSVRNSTVLSTGCLSWYAPEPCVPQHTAWRSRATQHDGGVHRRNGMCLSCSREQYTVEAVQLKFKQQAFQ